MMCNSYEALKINGVLCHEQGCPDAWKDYERECCWCGTLFKPEGKNQYYCSDDCFAIDNGIGDDFDDFGVPI